MEKVNPEINKFVLADTSKFVSTEIKYIAKPLGILALIVALFVGSFYFGLGQINKIRTQIDASKKDQKVLATKVSVLRNITNVLPTDISFVDVALPAKGIALYGMSQVKTQANLLGLTIADLRTGGVIQEKDGLSRISISFDVTGDEQTIYNYLAMFPKMLPLMKVDKLSLSKIDGITSATVTLSAFSGDLPKKIPSLVTPVTDLTSEEVETLNEISGFSQPQFLLPSPTIETPKDNPFNLISDSNNTEEIVEQITP